MNSRHIITEIIGSKLLLLVLVLFLSCCQRQTNEIIQLEYALEFANGNRNELEKVLDYYSQNQEYSLKYKAACFLIRNMPNYYSIYSPENDSIKKIFQAVAHKQMTEDKALEIAKESFVPNAAQNQRKTRWRN